MTNIPKDFSAALKASGLNKFFSDYAPSHQREHLKWITEAKKPETRKRRIEKTVQTLFAKRAEKTARSKKKA